MLQPKLCYWHHSCIYFCSARPSTAPCLSPEVWHLFIYKALGISPCNAKGFHSGLGMVSAMGMEEKMTLGPFVPWGFCRGFGKAPHIMCINEIVEWAVSEQLDHKDAMQQGQDYSATHRWLNSLKIQQASWKKMKFGSKKKKKKRNASFFSNHSSSLALTKNFVEAVFSFCNQSAINR